ncbi:MAG: pentapeptide repeat-containing protein [Desulfuromonadaceae bacterium]|nr:pentapeptide repeat-containing protein [Desulfuromonadaceae bacterium]
MKNADFTCASLPNTDLSKSEITFSNFSGASLGHADFSEANLEGTKLSANSLLGTNFYNANLQSTTGWNDNLPISLANIHGIKNAPPGFYEWAISHGAVDEPDIQKWKQHKKNCITSGCIGTSR